MRFLYDLLLFLLDIYFHCDTLCYSNDGLNVNLITVSSMKNITNSREQKLPNLFPDDSKERSHVFNKKKVSIHKMVLKLFRSICM